MKKILINLKNRWLAETPTIYKWLRNISATVATVALAINTACVAASAMMPSWWERSYPYMIGIGAAIAAVFQLTKKKDGKLPTS